MKEYDQALENFNKSVEIYDKIEGNQYKVKILVMANIALVYQANQQNKKAVSILTECFKIIT